MSIALPWTLSRLSQMAALAETGVESLMHRGWYLAFCAALVALVAIALNSPVTLGASQDPPAADLGGAPEPRTAASAAILVEGQSSAPPSHESTDAAQLAEAAAWTYDDLEVTAVEGGGTSAPSIDTTTESPGNPHSGLAASGDRCDTCHGTGRTAGAYSLIRTDSRDDACDYCHVGGSAHSGLVVYDLNSAGKLTTNGHTIGASSAIPDSSVAQWTEEITLESIGADGSLISETIRVRAYDEQKNDMYRLIRNHGHTDPGTTGAYLRVGPVELTCVSCHQVHNTKERTWDALAMASMGNDGAYTGSAVSSYKLLKASPSGSTWGTPVEVDGHEYWAPEQVAHVPEATLTAGVNYDVEREQGEHPGTQVLTDGTAAGRPVWIAQRIGSDWGAEDERFSPAAVNNAALSVWCADCHNLNIGGSVRLDHPELGYKSHTERTHPAPFIGGASGPGQCYSCHRNDLPAVNRDDLCSQCHYGTGNYRENRTRGEAEYVASDFPHSGENGGYKMLGSYSTDVEGHQPTVIDEDVVITADNLDAVCVRCHWME